MALPNRKPSMPPPEAKKPAVVIGIGTAKPKEGGDPTQPDNGGDGGKEPHKLESAGVVRADKHCQQCENYVPEDGSCNELPGSFDPDDACVKYFEPLGDSGDPDEGAEGEGTMTPPEPANGPVSQ